MATGADLAGSEIGPGNGRANGTGNVRARDRRADVDQPSPSVGEVAVPEAGDSRRVEVAESTAGSAPQWDTNASLKLRLLRAQRDVSTLTKDAEIKGQTKSGGTFSYKGISSAQVVAVAKSALLDHGVLFTAEIEIESVKIDGNKTRLIVVGTFESADSNDTKIVRMWGEGTDNADNGHAKAFTSGTKQILLKQLNLTTAEDEKQTEVEHQARPTIEAVRQAEAVTEVAVKQWADAYRAALRGAASLRELKQIRAENSDMMKRVPDATREYFEDMIAGLEGTLS